jgi:hypothetical protein
MADTRRDVWMRWRTIRQLDAWLETPMIVLSFLWLVIVVVELVWGTWRLSQAIRYCDLGDLLC